MFHTLVHIYNVNPPWEQNLYPIDHDNDTFGWAFLLCISMPLASPLVKSFWSSLLLIGCRGAQKTENPWLPRMCNLVFFSSWCAVLKNKIFKICHVGNFGPIPQDPGGREFCNLGPLSPISIRRFTQNLRFVYSY
jgi:hypothetical protein